MANKISFEKRGGSYNVFLNNTALVSADVTITVDWEHVNRLQSDPVGKVVITGADNKRKEIFTPGSSGSSSVTFPVHRDQGRRYPLTFDIAVDAEVSSSNTRILRLYHRGISVKTLEKETFMTQEGGDWGLKIPNGVAEGSSVEFYMERNDNQSTDGSALKAFECPVNGSTNRMSFNNSTRDEESENVSLGGDGGQFYKFNLEGTQRAPKRNEGGSWSRGDFPSGPRLEFFDGDGNDVNAFLHIRKKDLKALTNRREGARITITSANVVMDGGTVTPEPTVNPNPPSACGTEPPVIRQEGGKWGVQIPGSVINPSTVTLKFKKRDNPNDYGIAISKLSVTGSGGGKTTLSLDRGQEKDEDSGSFHVSSSAKVFYRFTDMDNIQDPVYNDSAKRLEFRDRDGDDANAWIYIEDYQFTCDEIGEVIGPSDCAPGPWEVDGGIYNPSSVVEPVAPPIDTSGGGRNLVCSKSGSKDIILDLRNYANKLVTLELTYTIAANWTQLFDFNIPNCSDLYIDEGLHAGTGNEYNFPPYSLATNTANNKTFKIYNLDGGHQYVFKHDHITGPEPVREVFELVCVDTSEEVTFDDGSTGTKVTTTCTCQLVGTETWTSTGKRWPRFDSAVYITKSSGTSVSWIYEDGGGTTNGTPDDVYVNVSVKKVRDTVPYPPATLYLKDTLQRLAWTPSQTPDTDYNYGLVDGQSLADFYDHSDKIRLRVPSEKRSLLNLRAGGADMSEFRGCAGATYEAF